MNKNNTFKLGRSTTNNTVLQTTTTRRTTKTTKRDNHNKIGNNNGNNSDSKDCCSNLMGISDFIFYLIFRRLPCQLHLRHIHGSKNN
jgi:hypothetical protein